MLISSHIHSSPEVILWLPPTQHKSCCLTPTEPLPASPTQPGPAVPDDSSKPAHQAKSWCVCPSFIRPRAAPIPHF